MTRKNTSEMAELFQSGLTLQQIGDRYGITKQGVQQRLKYHGVDTSRPLASVRFESVLPKINKERLVDLYARKLSLVKIAAELQIDLRTVNKLLVHYRIPKREGIYKPGGVIVDELRKLKIGDSYEAPLKGKIPRAPHHVAANRIGIRIKTKYIGDKIKITRVA